jgi:hypothetical protein
MVSNLKGLPATLPPMYPHAVDLVLSVWATVSALPGQMTEKLTTINSTEAVVLIQRGSHQRVQTFVLVRSTVSTPAKDFRAVRAAQANIVAGAAMIAAAIQPIYSRLALRTS